MGIGDFLELIRKGAGHWNLWRKTNPSVFPDLDGIELIDLDLSGIDFSGLSITSAIINRCNLTRAVLISANFTDSNLQANNFCKAKMIAAKFINADLSDSDLSHANILTASVRGATLDRVNLGGQDLKSLDLRGVSLAGCELSDQVLAGADLSNTNLSDCILKNSDFKNVNFTSANLRKSTFIDCDLSTCNFRHANLDRADLQRHTLDDINFEDANLTNCDLREAHVINSNFSRADLTGSLLWKVQTKDWKLASVKCSFAYWDESAKQKVYYDKHEFERIYADSILIELRYPYRLSSAEISTLPIFIEHLQASFWGTIVRLKNVQDVAGGALVSLAVDEIGRYHPAELKGMMQDEANRIQMAQLAFRRDIALQNDLKEELANIKESFWPRLLELAAENEREHVRNLTIVFMDLKGFSTWGDNELSEKLSLFRGLIKPILERWHASYPNMEGDSLRVTFRNASAGLACACMMRSVLSAASFEVRVGVEVGEVMVVHNEVTDISDLEGSAVIMAARLEGAAEHGQVLTSEKVRHYITDKNLFDFKFTKATLRKSVGDKKCGDTISCYTIEMIKLPPEAS